MAPPLKRGGLFFAQITVFPCLVRFLLIFNTYLAIVYQLLDNGALSIRVGVQILGRF